MKKSILAATITAGALALGFTTQAAAAHDPLVGALVGGGIGAAVGGPPGAAVGAFLGLAIGASADHHHYRDRHYRRHDYHDRRYDRHGYGDRRYERRYEPAHYESRRYEPRADYRVDRRYYEDPRVIRGYRDERRYDDRRYDDRRYDDRGY